MANEPSWDEIFRPGGGEPVRPTAPASPEPSAPGYPDVRASDPYAVAAAEARPQTPSAGEPLTRRQLREQEEQQASRGGRSPATELNAPKKPRKRRRGLVALAIVVVSLLVLGGGGFAFAWVNYETKVRELLGWQLPTDYSGTGNGKAATVVINSGDIGEDIARTLLEEKVTLTFDATYQYLLQHPEITFEPGNYTLQEQMSAASAVAALQDPANRVVNRVVIIEGSSYERALEQISAGTGLALADLQAAAEDYTSFGIPADSPNIEGWMFPATYQFDPGVTAHDAIQKTVDTMLGKLDELGVAPEDRLTVLKMAALVQREAGNVPDMAKIARVFQNRLDQGMLLQSDATVAYGTGNLDTVWTTAAERNDENNLYSTYVHPGLPYGPIGLPGEDAIKAAISPAAGPWLFFVPINLQTGETVFSTTAAEHEAAAQQLYAWCRASTENASYCK